MKYHWLLPCLVLLLSACKKETEPTYRVKYSIQCTDCQVVYYKDASETQATENHKNSTWSYSFNGKKGQSVLLFAYNTGSQMQGVTATIEVNGAVLISNTHYCPVSGYSFVTDTLR